MLKLYHNITTYLRQCKPERPIDKVKNASVLCNVQNLT